MMVQSPLKQVFRRHGSEDYILNLKSGELVEVRTQSEIAATLGKDGTLDGLPFVDEMWKFCNRRFTVLKPVEKIVVEGVGIRRIRNVVILKGATCDGTAHGDCKRSCNLFWKEAWLKRVMDSPCSNQLLQDPLIPSNSAGFEVSGKGNVFSCQSTKLLDATSSLPFFDVRRYLLDIKSRTFRPIERLWLLLVTLRLAVLELLSQENTFAHTLRGKLTRTPVLVLGLKPGEIVEVKSKKEILATLDSRGRNRGLEFNLEMLKYCGGRYKVLKRLDRMINEQTGKMRQIANTVLLEDVTCDGKASGGCQRTCYCLWREIWLKRVPQSLVKNTVLEE
jgi:hypothetical protein